MAQSDIGVDTSVNTAELFDLFVETRRGNIDRFMDRLGTAYAMYFRYKHYRRGEGLARAVLIELACSVGGAFPIGCRGTRSSGGRWDD